MPLLHIRLQLAPVTPQGCTLSPERTEQVPECTSGATLCQGWPHFLIREFSIHCLHRPAGTWGWKQPERPHAQGEFTCLCLSGQVRQHACSVLQMGKLRQIVAYLPAGRGAWGVSAPACRSPPGSREFPHARRGVFRLKCCENSLCGVQTGGSDRLPRNSNGPRPTGASSCRLKGTPSTTDHRPDWKICMGPWNLLLPVLSPAPSPAIPPHPRPIPCPIRSRRKVLNTQRAVRSQSDSEESQALVAVRESGSIADTPSTLDLGSVPTRL